LSHLFDVDLVNPKPFQKLEQITELSFDIGKVNLAVVAYFAPGQKVAEHLIEFDLIQPFHEKELSSQKIVTRATDVTGSALDCFCYSAQKS
jgi:hypothetical protein